MNDQDDVAVQAFLAELIDDSITQILAHEDDERYLAWVKEQFLRCSKQESSLFDSAEESTALAVNFGRSVWNAFPLPGNGFRPRTLAMPGRNDPCPCGSDRKYKRCCGCGPPVPGLSSDVLWPLLIGKLPRSVVVEAVDSGSIPAPAMMSAALDRQERGRPKSALKFLEPLFNEPIRHCDQDSEFAFDMLCNLYDDLGYSRKKAALLQRIVATVECSPLRSGARQRLAAIRMDQGDIPGAWNAFKLAQRDAPDAPSLALLEVQLLMAERRPEAAADRASFWVRRLRSRGHPESDSVLPLLKSIARDPERAMAEIGIDISGGAGQRLLEWLDRAADREVPVYRLNDEPPIVIEADGEDFEDVLSDRLRELGVPDSEISGVIKDMDVPEGPGGMPPPESDSSFLEVAADVRAIEDDWHNVFPLGKPFSVNMLAVDADDAVWLPSIERKWSDFLESNPQAFESLDILDDLANAVLAHEHALMAGFDELLLQPILRRAQSIIRAALRKGDDVHLVWTYTENRPALRCLVNLLFLEERLGNERAMIEIAEQVLALNPNDNHGLRTKVINDRLRRNDDLGALQIAVAYPADQNPDIAYGQALALFRLGKVADADSAIREAVVDLPKVVRYLLVKRVRKPKIDPVGVLVGGEDQAWLYREEMRDVWRSSSGALDWLKRHCTA